MIRTILLTCGSIAALIAGLAGFLGWAAERMRRWGDHPTPADLPVHQQPARRRPIIDDLSVEGRQDQARLDADLDQLAHIVKAFEMRLHMTFERGLRGFGLDEDESAWSRVIAQGRAAEVVTA